jgi:ATP-dependent helicase STH1/SNF2
MNAPDYEPILPGGAKRKRGLKSMSVTPSANDDDDDERDQVRISPVKRDKANPGAETA